MCQDGTKALEEDRKAMRQERRHKRNATKVASTTTITYTCPTCHKTCGSRIALYSHQKTHCWKSEVDVIIRLDGQLQACVCVCLDIQRAWDLPSLHTSLNTSLLWIHLYFEYNFTLNITFTLMWNLIGTYILVVSATFYQLRTIAKSKKCPVPKRLWEGGPCFSILQTGLS